MYGRWASEFTDNNWVLETNENSNHQPYIRFYILHYQSHQLFVKCQVSTDCLSSVSQMPVQCWWTLDGHSTKHLLGLVV